MGIDESKCKRKCLHNTHEVNVFWLFIFDYFSVGANCRCFFVQFVATASLK